jgi:hypothetical protein
MEKINLSSDLLFFKVRPKFAKIAPKDVNVDEFK